MKIMWPFDHGYCDKCHNSYEQREDKCRYPRKRCYNCSGALCEEIAICKRFESELMHNAAKKEARNEP